MSRFAQNLEKVFPEDVIRAVCGEVNFSAYQDDPVGFGEEVLGERYTDDIRKMMTSVRDNMITVAMSANATGKTHGAARVAVWWYKAFERSQVYTAAAPPEDNLVRLLWGEIGSLVDKHPNVFRGDLVRRLNIQRSALEFLVGVTIPVSGTPQDRVSKFSGKHAPHLLFIFDEGDAIPDEVFEGADGCMSGGHVRMLVMLNPKKEAGRVYRMIRDGLANVVHLSAFSHPNVVQGHEVIPGAVNRETTVRRINEWCRPLADDEVAGPETFELPQFLEGAVARSSAGGYYPALQSGKYKIVEPAFSYMVLGQYPAKGSNQLISKSWIANARQRWDLYVAQNGEIPPENGTCIHGQDVAEMGMDKNVAIFRTGGFVEKPILWDGVDTMATGERAARECKRRRAIRVCVDATGVGAGVAPHLLRLGCPAVGLKVASSPTKATDLGEFRILRDQLLWAVREWLRADPSAMLPPDNLLEEELSIPTYEVVNGKIQVMQKTAMRSLLGRSPDRLDALSYTFFEPELLYPWLK